MSPRIRGRSISRSIASPWSNIDVAVNGVRVVVTLMLRLGTTVSVADVTPRPPEPINAPAKWTARGPLSPNAEIDRRLPGVRYGS